MTVPDIMAKKRTKQQKIGEQGEAIFRSFALEHGLLPTKVEYDYGIDFLCQLEDTAGPGMSVVLCSCIGVNVRTSSQKKPRAKLKESDLKASLRSDFPMLFALVDLRQKLVYYQFLDLELLNQIHGVLAGGAKSLSLTPKAMKPETEGFCQALRRVSTSEYRGRLRLRRAQLDLANVLGNVRLRLHQTMDGGLAIIEIADVASIFRDKDAVRPLVRDVMLARRLKADTWSGGDALKPVLTKSLSGLVSKAVVLIPSPFHGFKTIAVRREGIVVARCSFECRRYDQEISFYHPSGLTLIMSECKKDGAGRCSHDLEIRYDDPSAEPLFDHPEIIRFLKKCQKHAEVVLSPNARSGIPMSCWPELVRLGKVAHGLGLVYQELQIDHPPVTLRHINELRFARSFSLLETLARERKNSRDILPGFADVPEDVEIRWRPALVFCPVHLALPGGPALVDVECDGRVGFALGAEEAPPVGIRFDRKRALHLCEKPELSEPGDWPTMVIAERVGISLREDESCMVDTTVEAGVRYKLY